MRTEMAAICGSISLWLYCLVNECCFLHESVMLCSPQHSLIISLCFYWSGLSPVRSPCISPAFYRYQQQWSPVFVCAGMNCVQSTWPLSLLFSLKCCNVAEHKATSRSPPLQVGIVVYFYPRAEVAVIEADAARFSPTALVCCQILFHCYIKSISFNRWDLRISHVGHTGSRGSCLFTF